MFEEVQARTSELAKTVEDLEIASQHKNQFVANMSHELRTTASQAQYSDLDLDNIVMVTLPQPIVVQMIRTGAIALGNLTLEVSRRSGFYPDIVMAGPDPLRELRKLEAIEQRARFFSKNRGFALLVRKGNPLQFVASPTWRAQARA